MSDKSQVTCYFAPNLAWGWDLWWTYLAKCRTSSWEDWASFPAWMMIIQIGAPNSWSSHVKPSSNPTIYNNPSQILNRLIRGEYSYEITDEPNIFHVIPGRQHSCSQSGADTVFCVILGLSINIASYSARSGAHHSPMIHGGRELIVQNIFLGVGLREINKSVSGDNRLP